MKTFLRLSLVATALIWPVAMVAQDAVKVDPSHYKVVLENASVRVVRVSYPPGAKSVMHQHPDSLIVALGPAKVRFTLADGKTQDSDFANESATYTPAGTHTPANIGSGAVDGVLVEFKGAVGKAVLPTSRPGMTLKMLAEGPRAVAYRATETGKFSEPAGSKHDFDQVIVALGPSTLSLAVEGQPARKTWARGDVVFIGRGVAHESNNVGGKPADMIVVGIR